MVENLSATKSEGLKLSVENFRDTLKGTWQRRYQKATQKYPDVIYIYDAIELIQNIGLELRIPTIRQASEILGKMQATKRLSFKWKFYLYIKQLIKTENLLNPRDGQIEGKGYQINEKQYLPDLYIQIFQNWARNKTRSIDKVLYLSLMQPILFFIPKSTFDPAKHISLSSKILGPLIGLPFVINDVAIAYAESGFPKLAGEYFRKSLEIKESNLVYRTLFRQSIAEGWDNLGISYRMANKGNEAIEFFEKALHIRPKYAKAWNTLGNSYYDLGQYDDALQAYNKAIETNKRNANVWGNLGILYMTQKKIDKAIEAFKNSLAIDPQYTYSNLSLALCYKIIDNFHEAQKLIDSVEPIMNIENEYTQACFHIAQGDSEKGLVLLKAGLKKQQTSMRWAQKDPNFESIRDDLRFKELVGLD